jgi:uncharacterized coiled-coil DUF342 family protein
MYTLDDDDREHQEYLDGVMREQEERDRAAVDEMIGQLDEKKERRDTLVAEATAAKALYDSLNPADISQRPADWTQEKLDEAEAAFFDLEKEAREVSKEVDKVQGLKDEKDAAMAA